MLRFFVFFLKKKEHQLWAKWTIVHGCEKSERLGGGSVSAREHVGRRPILAGR